MHQSAPRKPYTTFSGFNFDREVTW
jgi:hypothetical protein